MLFLSPMISFSQNKKAFFSAETAFGRIVPNYINNYPRARIRSDFTLNLNFSVDAEWAKYYNYPTVGIAVLHSRLGNQAVFGNQSSLYTFLRTKAFGEKRPVFLKFGIGLAYFDKMYDVLNNSSNLAVGSALSWHFNASFSKLLTEFERGELHFTGGFYHASNGHTQIPNYGLNAALLGLEYRFRREKEQKTDKNLDGASSFWVLEQRFGLGFHELANTLYPVGGPKYLVYSKGINMAYVQNDHVKYKIGLVYRYYDSYFKYIQSNRGTATYAESSNGYFMAGTEFLLGHIGIDIEGGLNFYKPFFKEFYSTFENRNAFDYFTKRWFNTRMGLNYYLFDNYANKRFNVKIGAHINANFGQADFSDASLGFTYRLD